MRKVLATFVLFIALQLPQAILYAQETGWCGYALIQGLPLLANQLSSLESITPDKTSTVNPSSLFQYRFSLDHSQVIIEGCWKTNPSRDLVVSLLSQTIQYDSKAMAAQVEALLQEAVITGDQVTTSDVVRDYVDQVLVYSIFEGKTRDESATLARAYIQDNLKDWEEPSQ